MMKKRLQKNDRGFWFMEFSDGPHWKHKSRVWVHRSMVPEALPDSPPALTFPIKGRVERTEKGSLVLRPSENFYVYLVEVDSGYRGFASIEISGGEIIASGEDFHSPRGNLGETAWAIINAQAEIKVTGKRTGRHLPRDGEIIEFTIFPDGQVVSAEEEEVMAIL